MEATQYEIHMTREYVIVSKGTRSLWCSRRDGSLKPGSVVTPDGLESSHYLGKCWGLVGKIQFFAGAEWKLLLIGSARSVGVLPSCGQVHCIERLIVIPLTTDPSPEIVRLESPLTDSITLQRDASPAPGRKASSVKTEGGGGGGGKPREAKEKDKLERRLMEALLRMFNDSHSFYFSTEGDLTHTQQRKLDLNSSTDTDSTSLPFWQKVDDRFFWNKWMLQDLLDITCQRSLVEPWVLPIIQGYVETRTLVVHSNNPPDVLQTHHSDRTSARWKRETSRQSHSESGAGEEGEEVEMTEFEDKKTKLCTASSNLLTLVQEDRPEMSCRSDASGYESDRDSTSGEEEAGEGSGGERKNGAEWTYSLPSNPHDVRHSPGGVQAVGRDSRDSSESGETEQFTVQSKKTENEEENRTQVERLKLVIEERGEDSDDGEQRLRGGEERTSEMEKQLSVVSKEDSEVREGEGERGRLEVVAVETGSKEEREGEEQKQQNDNVDGDEYIFTITLISRRSRHRAGTRYRRRGVDSLGNVANFVETEMILQAGSHCVSYVLVRGSVPVFWTQPGAKYRPPPVIERGEEETQEAFNKHFDSQFSLYNNVAITNLINQSGRESVLGDAFEKHVLMLDSPQIAYITFDFHRHLKGNQSGALKELITATHNQSKKYKFCWVDTNITSGPLCRQEGVFRVNCMDCLDRTNVVQTAFCREFIQTALQKLGIIPFDEHLSGATLSTFKMMWANNGDCISRQYTGTAAMKGDLTRYGERKFSGMMKDGYNSAHRYYQNLFRDSYRQVLIDLMQGTPHPEAFSSLPPSLRGQGEEGEEEDEEEVGEELWSLDREQAIAEMIQLCREELFPVKTHHVVGWALIEAAGYSFVELSRKEEDCVLLQCREKNQLCVANYNVEDDQVTCFIRIPMEKVEKIVIGPLGTIIRSSKRLHLRIYYTLMDKQCYFTFKTVNFTSLEEDRDILLSIATTLSHICPTIIIQEQKLTKKKSPLHQGVIYLVMPKDVASDKWKDIQEDSLSPPRDTIQSLHVPVNDSSDSNMEGALDEDDEREQSLSVPASPTLVHRSLVHVHGRLQRLRSQSFDDIASSVNNEEDLPPSPSKSPMSYITGSSIPFQIPPRVNSASESDTEGRISIPWQGLGVIYNNSLTGSQPELTESSTAPWGAGKFNQFKGRFLQKFKRGYNSQKVVGLQVPQAASDRPTSGSGSDIPQDAAEETSSLSHRLLAVGQRFRNSPPSLLRRIGMGGRGSPTHHLVPPISGSETGNGGESRREAREKSKSNFITL